MFGFFKRKREEEYKPMFEELAVTEEIEPAEEPEEPEEESTDPYADLEPGEVIGAAVDDGEITRLEDGREFPAAFVREVRGARAEELKLIIEKDDFVRNRERLDKFVL